MVKDDDALSFTDLARIPLNLLDGSPRMQSFSVAEWMLHRHPEALVAMLASVRAALTGVAMTDHDKVAEASDSALERAFGKPLGEVERDWRRYVLETYSEN